MKIEKTISPSNKDIDFITHKINEEAPEFGEAYPFAFYIRNEQEEMMAGCNGSVVFGNIYTDQLWVDPKKRSQGLAKILMEQVHAFGREIGCNMATVSTMSFQGARPFYEKIGYKVDFERKGYVQESSCFFMVKVL